MIKRALISVYDKTGLEEFASGLAALGIELVARHLQGLEGTVVLARDRRDNRNVRPDGTAKGRGDGLGHMAREGVEERELEGATGGPLRVVLMG